MAARRYDYWVEQFAFSLLLTTSVIKWLMIKKLLAECHDQMLFSGADEYIWIEFFFFFVILY